MRGKMAFLAVFVISGGVALMASIAPQSVQAQIVTPYPGAVATATAAAQTMSAAQGQQDQASQRAAQQAAQAAQYAAAAQHAAQQAQQAAQAKAAADAAFNAASQAAADARAALVAQQVGAASELLGRSEESINAGKAQIDTLAGIVTSQKQTIDSLAAQLQKSQTDLQQERTAKKLALDVNAALQKRVDEAESRFTINPTIIILACGFLLVLVLGFVAWKWSRNNNDNDDPPPIDGGYTISQDEVIDHDDREQDDPNTAP